MADAGPNDVDALMPVVYDELRRVARRYLRGERSDHTLQTTGLVHEAYLRLRDQRQISDDNRAQFVGLAAMMMRRILVNHAEARRADKRGGAVPQLVVADLDEIPQPAQQFDVVELHHAIERLEALNARQAKVVELRYFGGLDVRETAGVLGVSEATVHRDWAVARLWLRRELMGGDQAHR